jgi:hypothetical protein
MKRLAYFHLLPALLILPLLLGSASTSPHYPGSLETPQPAEPAYSPRGVARYDNFSSLERWADPVAPESATPEILQLLGDDLPGLDHLAAAPEAPDATDYYTALVYQVIRNDNDWELYFKQTTTVGSGDRRLTNNAYDDVYPALNRGATQVAFASHRNGSWDIYLVNTDGSQERPLVAGPENASMPAWSPDGRKIVYAADYDGWVDLYIIDVMTGAQQRLTQDTFVDVDPAWSPDGTMIAWVRVLGSYHGQIMSMNVDGTGLRNRAEPMLFVSRPAWSPTQVRIAFEYDMEGDGWLDIGWLLTEYNNAHSRLISGRRGLDYTMGAFTNTSKLVAGQIVYIEYAGNFYIYFTDIVMNSSSGSVINLQVEPYPFFPDAALWETSVPQSWILPLPRYSRVGETVITARSYDPGPAFVEYLNLEYREAGEELWRNLDQAYGGNDLNHAFAGAAGNTYHFRSYAVDHAGNQQRVYDHYWDQITSMYRYLLAGRLVDNRGHGIAGVAVNAFNPYFGNQTSIDDGRFNAYVSHEYNHFSMPAPGFGTLPHTAFLFDEDIERTWILPPIDNILPGGDFEEGLDEWLFEGALKSRVIFEPLSGSNALQTGMASPLADEMLIAASQGAAMADMAIGTDGKQYAVWTDRLPYPGDPSPDRMKVYFSSRAPGNGWNLPEVLDPGAAYSAIKPTIETSGDGWIHVIWGISDWYDTITSIFYRSRSPEGVWSSTSTLASLNAWDPNYRWQMKLDLNGGVHVVHNVGASMLYCYRPDPASNWQAPSPIANAYGNFSIAVSPDNRIHLVAMTNNYWSHRSRAPGGSWSVATTVTELYSWESLLTIDTEGNLHLLLLLPQLKYLNKPAGAGTWSSITVLAPHDEVFDVAALTDFSGNIHIIYSLWEGSFYTAVKNGSTLGPVNTHLSSRGVGLAIAPDGQIHGVFGDSQIMYFRLHLPEQGSSLVSSTVDLPASLRNPTLSFAYRTQGQAGAGTLRARVNGDDVLTTSAIVTDWRHTWLDLSAYAGQAVTVSFEVTNPDTSHQYVAFLDDVSLGSWTTPLIETVSKTQIKRGQTLTITGENFLMGVTARLGGVTLSNIIRLDENTLTAVIPAYMPPGAHRLWVANISGQTGLFAQPIVVGSVAYLPLSIRR